MENVSQLKALDRKTLRDLRDSLVNERLDIMDRVAALAGIRDDPEVERQRAELAAQSTRLKVQVKRCNEAMVSKQLEKAEAKQARKEAGNGAR